MKLSLKSHSVRFRISSEELAQLTENGSLSCQTVIPDSSGETAVFTYQVKRSGNAVQSDLQVLPRGFILALTDGDISELAAADKKSVYLRRAWSDSNGQEQRCVIYIEEDKKKGKSKKRKDTGGAEVALQSGELKRMEDDDS